MLLPHHSCPVGLLDNVTLSIMRKLSSSQSLPLCHVLFVPYFGPTSRMITHFLRLGCCLALSAAFVPCSPPSYSSLARTALSCSGSDNDDDMVKLGPIAASSPAPVAFSTSTDPAQGVSPEPPRAITLPPRWLEAMGGPDTLKGGLVIDKEGEPTEGELSNGNLLKVLGQACTDEEVNWLVWKCLGYRYNSSSGQWSADKVFPNWSSKYPEAPDLVGVTRNYSREVDGPVLKANQALVRSIPLQFKQTLKDELRPLGFTGFKVDELTPNRTRRAQVSNFILFYRSELWGVSLEELKRRKQESQQQQEHIAHKPLGEVGDGGEGK
ncbi:unnamed protein product [Chrysoparadoxa australica]